ncbi:MAG: replication-associated recombination protein A [Nitrospiraceae bacterium]
MASPPHQDTQGSLFCPPAEQLREQQPLAERLRPREFSEFVGQEHLIAPDRPLRRAIETDTLRSVILWGPPGSGKTTLAHLIASHTKATFVFLSAITSGIADLRTIVQAATQRRTREGRKTIVFVDEIHRFNKAQQDAFLPHVEQGTIILLGATTENPSFEVIAPLLSRSIVVVLQPLDDEAIGRIIDRALTDRERGLGARAATVTPGARQRLIGYGNHDARAALTMLEHVVTQTAPDAEGRLTIDEAALDAALVRTSLRYDRNGEEHYNLISAFIKSLRDSDADAAVYWLARMLEGGEDPVFLARRLVIFASEDIGNAEPQALTVAMSVAQAVQFVGLPEARINLAHGTTYLARCPKDNASYVALQEATADATTFGNLPVPLHLRNGVTGLMRRMDYGKNYRYAHDDPEGAKAQAHRPSQLEGKRYYRPKSSATRTTTDGR